MNSKVKIIIGIAAAVLVGFALLEWYMKTAAAAKATTSLSGTPIYIAGLPGNSPSSVSTGVSGASLPLQANPPGTLTPLGLPVPGSVVGLPSGAGTSYLNFGASNAPSLDTTDLSIAGGSLPMGNTSDTVVLGTVVPPIGDTSGAFSDASTDDVDNPFDNQSFLT